VVAVVVDDRGSVSSPKKEEEGEAEEAEADEGKIKRMLE